ncbi:peptidyl-tRNA hydrolase [Paenibacillus mesophilus]|uniref:aminoacyl-tRNA hydrolase n=1 Tax=Paenibacillus mesophilus TaxID=2582849 RepID=UPI00110DD016|nr:aminoacyl-tRNA hydrolase [Paenibacillus mesophilus]TMV51466.1 peptidyl-tRNA hydrolase [Paenibacillus mesophilus]
MTEEIVQYYVVNRELSMSPGKMAAQAAHAATVAAIDLLRGDDSRFPSPEFLQWFAEWYRGGMKKIVLKGTTGNLEKLTEHGFYPIHDGGLTEIPSGSLTVVCLPPMPKSKAQAYVKGLSLC